MWSLGEYTQLDARSESGCVFFFQQNAMVIKWHFHIFSWDDLY